MATAPYPPDPELPRRGRRVAGPLLGVLVAAAGAIGLIAFFTARDVAEVSPTGMVGPGTEYRDLGARHLKPGETARVRYNSDPPTSGPHVPVAVRRAEVTLSDDQLLHAIEQGNVVLLYGSPAPPPGLRELANRLAGPFDPALAQGGQAVILARRPGVRGVVAVAWRHVERAPSARSAQLRGFVDFWLGRGKAK